MKITNCTPSKVNKKRIAQCVYVVTEYHIKDEMAQALTFDTLEAATKRFNGPENTSDCYTSIAITKIEF